MTWPQTFACWQMYLIAALPAGLIYLVLKRVVPVGKTALGLAATGFALSRASKDADFARVGLAMAAQSWQRRKRIMLGCAIAAGLVISSLVYWLVPAFATMSPGASALLALGCLGAGVGLIAVSKY